ncbi:type IV secretory system conjugative DNA transfer family protein [Vibrio cholerae]|uniref:type IV secretory system conjugative DNA transfer family protein n=1 Tax=Vibrio cholerae TaxID=666 RepID=UPI00301AED3A
MKKIFLLLLAFSSHAFTSEPQLGLYDYYYNLDANNVTATKNQSRNLDELSLVDKAIYLESKKVGREAGIYKAESVIKSMLEKLDYQLDAIMDVSYYVGSYKNHLLIPAIVIEMKGRKEYVNDEHSAFVYAGKTYVIHRQPYFSDKLPNWKDYIVLRSEPPTLPDKSLLPSTEEQKVIWKDGFNEGWQSGINTAIESFKFQSARALFDMNGMKLYGMLRDAKILSEPIITDSNYNVTGSESKLELDSGMVRIVTKPIFNHNATEWKIIPELPPISDLLPSKYLEMIEGAYYDK